MSSAKQLIEALRLSPHPEGGWYRETWQAPARKGERAAGTAIVFLLERGQRSHWHRIDASEIWHFYSGAPLRLRLCNAGEKINDITLGADFSKEQTPQAIVPPHCWQSAQSLGAWTLVGCTVSPGFEFSRFELAPPGWAPGD